MTEGVSQSGEFHVSLSVTTTGEFSLELYSYQTGVPLEHIETAFNKLTGPVGLWHITVHDPDEHNPHGRLVIEHRTFDKHTQIVIASGNSGHQTTYDVYQPMKTDILTEADNVSIETALNTAIETANTEINKQSVLAPAFAVTDRVQNALAR